VPRTVALGKDSPRYCGLTCLASLLTCLKFGIVAAGGGRGWGLAGDRSRRGDVHLLGRKARGVGSRGHGFALICASLTVACSELVEAPSATFDAGVLSDAGSRSGGMDANVGVAPVPRWAINDGLRTDRSRWWSPPTAPSTMDSTVFDARMASGDTSVAETGAEDATAPPADTGVESGMEAGMEAGVDMHATGCTGDFMQLNAVSAGDVYAAPGHMQPLSGFGYSVSLVGELLLVTSPFERPLADQPMAQAKGSLHLARREGAGFGMTTALGPGDAPAGEGVLSAGTAAFVSPLLQGSGMYSATAAAGRVILGVPTADDDMGESGVVYVFEEQAGAYVQTQRFAAPTPRPCAFFGASVAAEDEILVVTAPGEGLDGTPSCTMPQATRAGAAYVYRHDGVQYQLEQQLPVENAMGGDYFGWSAAVSKGEIAIGSRNERNSTRTLEAPDTRAFGSGAVYVYRKNESWELAHYLKADPIVANTGFGSSLLFTDDELFVGAPHDRACSGAPIEIPIPNQPPVISGSGAVYVLDRSDYSQKQCVYGAGPTRWDVFGWALAVDGERLIVSAPYDRSADPADPANTNSPFSGAVYAFERHEDGRFTCAAYIKPPAGTGAAQRFGYSLAAGGGLLAVGAPGSSHSDLFEAGAVHLFRLEAAP
jgi:hypothetical protein